MTPYFGYLRPFSSQMGEDDSGKEVLFNNCWACAINSIKGRGQDDQTWLLKCNTLPGYNNTQEGLSFERAGTLLNEFAIAPIPPTHPGYTSLFAHQASVLQCTRGKPPHEQMKQLVRALQMLLKDFGPILVLRESYSMEGMIHAISFIDFEIQEGNILLYNSNMPEEQWASPEDIFYEIQMTFKAASFLKAQGLSPLYYDTSFKPARSFFGSLAQYVSPFGYLKEKVFG